jgi:hypothetical protein
MIAIPLNAIYTKPGGQLWMNLVRTGDPDGELFVWSPTMGAVTRPKTLAKFTLDDNPGLPEVIPDDTQLEALRHQALRGWWRFDESEGDIAVDSSSLGRSGKLKGYQAGIVGRVAGVSGKALYCSGEIGGYVTVADHKTLDINGPVTLETWIKRDARGGVRGHPAIAGKGQGQQDGAYSLHTRHGRKLWFEIDSTDNKRFVATTQHRPLDANAIAPATWQHLVATWDGQAIRVYLNGRPSSEPEIFNGQITNNDQPFTIGWVKGCGRFYGAIDEVALYARSMSEGEIYARFRANKSFTD